MEKKRFKNIFNKYKNLIYIIVFVLINLSLVFIVSSFAIYQKYIDLNLSIINGLNLAVRNGVIMADLRGSVLDVADSYLQSGIMSSSHLINDIKNVELINKNPERCDLKKIFLVNEDFNYKLSFTIDQKNNIYICFENSFYSETRFGNKKIAHWITGFPVNFSSISSNIKYIAFSSLTVIMISMIILYLILKYLDRIREKELTLDIANKIKHEIVRPIAKIQSITEVLSINFNKLKSSEIKDRIYQINLLTKMHKLFVWSMFSSVLNKDSKNISLNSDEVNIEEIFDKCINTFIKDKSIQFNITKNISNFLQNNLIIIDESYFAISLLNLLTNAYEAVQQNNSKEKIIKDFILEFEASFDKKKKKLSFSIKNYGSFIAKDRYLLIFNPGISFKSLNSGYGLSILKDIVDKYNGIIKIDSDLNSIDMSKSWVKFSLELNNIDYTEICKNYSDNNICCKNNIFILKSLKILISDDEMFYIDYFRNILSIFTKSIEVFYACNIKDSLDYIDNNSFDICIIDIKFGLDDKGGIALINKLKYSGAYIIVHSSSFYKDNSFLKDSISEYIQKTITQEKLSEIITKVYQAKYLKNENILLDKNEFNMSRISEKFDIIVVDDESHMYKNWEEINQNVNFIYFSHFDELFDSIDSKKIDTNKIQLILTDYYFDKVKTGMTLLSNDNLGTLRDIYDYEGFVVLVSNISLQKHVKIDAIIEKTPIKIDKLLNQLKSII